jgi:hypothetical protein
MVGKFSGVNFAVTVRINVMASYGGGHANDSCATRRTVVRVSYQVHETHASTPEMRLSIRTSCC